MVDFARLAKKAKEVVDKRGDKIASGVDKATDFVDKKTKGRHHDKLQKVDDAADELDKTKSRPRVDEHEEPPPPPNP